MDETYVTKNYTEQGGEITHIGGKLVIEEGAEVTGLSGGGSSYTLPQATAGALGGIKADAKDEETVECKIDAASGKLYVPTYPVLPTQATAAKAGLVKADTKTAGETVECKIDTESGKLYVPTYPVVPAAPTKATTAKEGLVKQATKVDKPTDEQGENLKTTIESLIDALTTAGILAGE